ncbi:MAG: SDR family oxidoreductase [Patescibacteria group bacterium]
MRIAVFGGRGFIGREFVKMAPRSYKTFLFNRPEADILRPETYSQKLKEIQPDTVVNVVAKIGTLLSSVSVREMFETNTMGSLNLAYAAHEAGAKSYVFMSSTVVHGENKRGEHHQRFDLFAPKHPYSASKAAAEYALEQFSKEQKNMAIVTLRPPMVIGEGVGVPLPPIEFVREVLAGKEIQIFGDGLHEREYVSVKDAAEGIWKAIDWSLSAEKGYHPFFLTGNRISMKDLAEMVVKKFEGKVVYVPSTKQTFSLTTDPSDSKKLFAWEIQDDVDAILDRVADCAVFSKQQA